MSEVTDPRVHQANERTLLAWLRTGVSLMAFGFVLGRSSEWLSALKDQQVPRQGVTLVLGVVMVLLGALTNLFAVGSYHRVRRAISENRPVAPTGAGVTVLALVLAVLGGVLAWAVARG